MLPLHACARCGHECFPEHLRCWRCGSVDWVPAGADRGTVEHTTIVRRSLTPSRLADPPRVALVRTDSGLRIVARLLGEVADGARVSLAIDGGAPVARPLGLETGS